MGHEQTLMTGVLNIRDHKQVELVSARSTLAARHRDTSTRAVFVTAIAVHERSVAENSESVMTSSFRAIAIEAVRSRVAN
jgi:hypothetical protein